MKDQASSIFNVLIEWTVRFVREIVAPWIASKGGWVRETHFSFDFLWKSLLLFFSWLFFAMLSLSHVSAQSALFSVEYSQHS